MLQLNFWSITRGYDVKYILPVGIDKFSQRQENVCFCSDIKQLLTNQFSVNIKSSGKRSAV